MTRQRTGMWGAEVHLAQGGIWVGKLWPMLMEGTYIGSTSGEVRISDGGQTVTADDSVCSQSP